MAFSFFFRDEPILALAAEKLTEFSLGRTNVRVWNPGCAMGQETYTFAILLAEKTGKFAFRNVQIFAADIDNENVDFGKTITDGIYPHDQLQRIPKQLFEKYFAPADQPNHFIVGTDLRNAVSFQKYDLLTLKPVRTDFSMVICKNVLLHFSYVQRIDVVKMFHDSLLPGGLLVMENTQPLPVELQGLFQKNVEYAQLYQKI